MEIMAIHINRNFVISGVTSELIGMLPATIRHKNERERKDSIARPTRSPVRCGDENVKIAKHVITRDGIMTLNRKKPGCLLKCRTKSMYGYVKQHLRYKAIIV